MEGEKLSKWQAADVMAKQWGPGHPDIVIYLKKPLALELKKDIPFRKDGKLKSSDHLKRQHEWLEYLRSVGWSCHFVWDIDQAKTIIEEHIRIWD
jgi:hypothetical protein